MHREEGEEGRKENGKEKGEKEKREMRKRGKRKGGVGGIRGAGREPGVASTRSDATRTRNEETGEVLNDD